MMNFKVHLGYIHTENKQQYRFGLKPFDFDLTKFPSLFINCSRGRIFPHKNEFVMDIIIKRALEIEKATNNFKTLVIDNGRITHCSALYYDNYYMVRPETALKQITCEINQIYKRYLNWPDFFPYKKYFIAVNNAWGLESYLEDIMPKLGPIGVYLVFSGGDEMLRYPCPLQNYLFGQIVEVSTNDFHKEVYVPAQPYGPNWGMVMERFKPEQKLSQAIYTDIYYNNWCKGEETRDGWIFD